MRIAAIAARAERLLRTYSAFYVSELGGYFAVADGKDVHPAQVPWPAISRLAINPAHHGAIAAHDDFLGIEASVGIMGEPRTPELDDGGFALDAAPVGSGRGIFKNGVVGQERGQTMNVVPVESIVEAVNGGACRLLLQLQFPFVLHGSPGGRGRQKSAGSFLDCQRRIEPESRPVRMASSPPIYGDGPAAQAESISSTYIQPTLEHGLRIWWAFYWRNAVIAIVLSFQLGAAVRWLGEKGMVSLRTGPLLLQVGSYVLNFVPAIFVMYYIIRKRFRSFRIRLTSLGDSAQVLEPTPGRVFRIWWTFTWRSIVYTIALSVAMTVPMGFVVGTATAISPLFGRLFNIVQELVVAGAVGLFVIYSNILDEEIADFSVSLAPAAVPALVHAAGFESNAGTDAQAPSSSAAH